MIHSGNVEQNSDEGRRKQKRKRVEPVLRYAFHAYYHLFKYGLQFIEQFNGLLTFRNEEKWQE
jgi:hypothetical protein